jgi:hypothetical protein
MSINAGFAATTKPVQTCFQLTDKIKQRVGASLTSAYFGLIYIIQGKTCSHLQTFTRNFLLVPQQSARMIIPAVISFGQVIFNAVSTQSRHLANHPESIGTLFHHHFIII